MPVDDGPERSDPGDSNGRWDSAALLEVVGSGPSFMSPPELLSSGAVGAVLAELGQRADVVLVDVPALLGVPDAAAAAAHVDGVVLVVSPRDARGPTLADTRRALESWRVANLGFVLTEGGDERPHARQFHRGKPSARARSAEPERVV
jgi:Mrp family chromosome partitioning ATPase